MVIKTVRNLLLASVLAVLVIGIPALGSQVHAEPTCGNGEGFCQDCYLNGYWFSAWTELHSKDGQHTFVCNGNTGQWVMVESVGPIQPINVGPIGTIAH